MLLQLRDKHCYESIIFEIRKQEAGRFSVCGRSHVDVHVLGK